jgi:hypothetical protein
VSVSEGWNPVSREFVRVTETPHIPRPAQGNHVCDIPMVHAGIDEAILHGFHPRDCMAYGLALHFYRLGLEDRLGAGEALKQEFPVA